MQRGGTDFNAQDLVSRLSSEDPEVTNGVLQVAHSIFKRWRPLFRSDELFTEINHVLSKFGTPFLNLLSSTDAAITQHASNKPALQQHMAVLDTSMKVLHDLSCQDLPDVLADNLDGVASLLEKYLKYENPLLQTDDESEAGQLEFVKSGIFGLLTLYIQKYDGDIKKYLPSYIATSWNLLTGLSPDTKNDILASRAMNFLTRVTASKEYAENFNNEDTLKQVVEKAILPNIALRESDVELFEDEPIEYIRRDLEGADSETRRRAATDFLRQLMEQFQERVTDVTMQYITHYIQEYTSNPTSNWKSKDTAVYLFCSIAAVGTVTSAEGVKTTNSHVNIIDFFQNHIAQDLTSDPSHAILQVDAVKYLYIFRSQLSRDQWSQAFPMLVRHLASQNYVVHTYCAIAVERILVLTNGPHEPVIPRSSVAPLAEDTLKQLFKLITKDTAAEKIQENEFLMRCVMRILIVIREDVLPLVDLLLPYFTNILNIIRHNPSNPRFYYYMFESIGALIRFAAPASPERLESTLYNPFALILQESIEEFMPYVFQLFAALLESNPSGTLSDFYKGLIGPILTPALWQSKGNVPALTRFLCALVSRGADTITSNNQIEPVLGTFQLLISSKAHETYAFDLLETIVESFATSSIFTYFHEIFKMILMRLSSSKTEALTLRFVRLYHFISSSPPTQYHTEPPLHADTVISVFEGIQPAVFVQLYTGIILPDTQKLSRPLDRKIAVISFTKTLADSHAFAEKYAKGWGYTAEALLKLMIDPPVPPAADDLIADQDVDDSSFGVGFTQLRTCKRPPKDPFPEATDMRRWIAGYLNQAAQRNGRLGEFVQQRLSEETRGAFAQLMQA